MRRKYERTARYPWLTVKCDLLIPESPLLSRSFAERKTAMWEFAGPRVLSYARTFPVPSLFDGLIVYIR